MELGRNVTLGRYMPGGSVVHRLDPRTKILAWLILAVGLFFGGTFVGFGIFAVFLILTVTASGVPGGYLLRGLRPMLPFLVIMYLFQIAFSTTLYPEGRDVVFEWWFVTVTGTGIRQSSLIIARVVLLFLSVTLLTLTTPLVMLVEGMERLGAPFRRIGVPHQELAMVAAIAVRFVPTLIEEGEKLMKAQTSRGARMDTGGFVQRTRARLPILVPLIINTLRRGDDLTNAMVSRCYRGGDHRTKRRQFHLRRADWLAGLAVLAVACAAVSIRFLSGLP